MFNVRFAPKYNLYMLYWFIHHNQFKKADWWGHTVFLSVEYMYTHLERENGKNNMSKSNRD